MIHLKFFKYLLLSALVVSFFGCAPAPKRVGLDSMKTTELQSHKVWRYEFKESIKSIYFTPNSLIAAITSREKSDSKDLEILKYYFNVKTGKIIWHGNLDKSLLIADNPHPVLLVLSKDRSPELVCYSYEDSKKIWTRKPEGTIIYAGSDVNEATVFTVTTTDSEKQDNHFKEAVLNAISAKTGNKRFSTLLGKIYLNYFTPNDILFCSNEIVYFGYGGIAAAVSMRTGKVIWKQSLKSAVFKQQLPINMWYSVKGGTLFASGRWLYLFSENKGVVWTTDVGKDRGPRTIMPTKNGVLISYWLKQGAGVMLIDINTGSLLWKYDKIVNKKEIRSPMGLVTLHNSVLYSVDGKLISLNIKDGSERFVKDIDVKESDYADLGLLLERNGKAVLLGNWSVRSYEVDSGNLDWCIAGFETPGTTFARNLGIATAFSTSVDMATDTYFGASTTTYGDMQKRWIKEYDFTPWYTNDGNLNIPVATRDEISNREMESKLASIMGQGKFSLNFVGIGSAAKPGLGRGGTIPDRYASFMNSLTKFIGVQFKGNVAVVNLETGATIFYTILPSYRCSPYAFSDSSVRWMIELYEKVSPICHDRVIEVRNGIVKVDTPKSML